MHPEHVTIGSRTTAREARAFTSVSVLKPGVALSGTVLSPFGRGVPGATVIVVKPPWEEMFVRLTTNKDGRFQ